MLGISDRDVEVMELAHNFSVLQDEIQRHLTNMKELVDTRTEELARERDKVRAKNKEITDSLRYARGLQETMLTSVSELQRVLPLSFVMSIPKDVVAGDFLWVRELEVNGRRRVLFALADCTGHGVPASLLTVMCHNALDDALEVLEEPLPCLLLDRVNEAFMEIAPSNEEQHLGDGMTIALCSYDPIDRSLVFAGSFQSIFLVDAGEIHRIDGDTVFLSVVSGERAGYFKDRYLQLDEGAMIYLLSDGFQDQFGGPSGRKMMRSRVAQLLLEASALETDAQGVFLTERFDDWKGSYEQVDDVLVLGIKVAPPPLSSSEKSSKE